MINNIKCRYFLILLAAWCDVVWCGVMCVCVCLCVRVYVWCTYVVCAVSECPHRCPAQVFNCLLWLWYGLETYDPAQTITNGIGLILGLTQLALLMAFKSTDRSKTEMTPIKTLNI